MKNDLYSRLISFLDEHHAKYRLIDHEPEGRTEIVSPMRGNKLSQAAKCMVLTVNIGKKETKYVLGVIPGDKQINFNAVKTLMHASYVSFTPEELTEKLAQSVVGTVLPFSFNPELELIVDPSLLMNDEFFFNAARLDRSIALRTKDYISIVKPRLAEIAKSSGIQKEIIPSDTAIANLCHSCAHLLAAAILDLYPNAFPTLGPAIENGFYYDFDNLTISENDLAKVESKMHELVKSWHAFEKIDTNLSDVKNKFPKNVYKIEMAAQYGAAGLTLYKSGEFTDLCRGGHCKNPSKELKYFKLLSVAGAYWRGSEKNKMLTRIYGTCWPTQKELDDYLNMLEESKKRDHRKIGRDLELFTISNDVGPGLTLWLPNGAIIRREIEDFMVKEQVKMGYKHVYSPHIGQKSLWEKSGHWDLYREKMYSPMDIDGVEYLVKPMTCPMHIQTYQFKPRSYRELPVRIAEIASVYRYEQSGELAGLLRVRAFTQDDAHIFCTQEQAVDEFLMVFNFIQKLYKTFGFNNYRVRLGIRSKKEKYLGSDSLWEKAQEKAIQALEKSGSSYFISEGDAAFYGPKADFLIKDALGREWQCGTVQIDFMLPERFDLKFIDQDGQKKTPVMIHRAPLGSLERFMAILIEHYAGAFPLWLAPVQAIVLPISDKHLEYAQKILDSLKFANIRCEFVLRNEPLPARVRDAEMQKIPYILVVGDREAEAGSVSVRHRGDKQNVTKSIAEFISGVTADIIAKV